MYCNTLAPSRAVLTFVLTTLSFAACAQDAPGGAPSRPPFDSPAFQQFWGDNKAEIAGYELTFPRYGQLRKGTAVTIFVTEPFSNAARVKADPGKHPPADEFPAMKLNLIEDFPTGVYDYNLMTSVFVALRPINSLPAGTPTKVSFSAQEWCGHVFHQILIDETQVRSQRHSYFDGDGDADETIENRGRGEALYEDAILLWARGLAGPFLKPGESREVDLLRSVKFVRLNHVPMQWERAKLTRRAEAEPVTVPAGTFDADVHTVEVAGDRRTTRTWTIHVERAHPHRILKWTCSSGEEAQLVGAERLTYWQMNRDGFEQALSKLGLQPRPPRTP